MTLLLLGALCFALAVLPTLIFLEAEFGSGGAEKTVAMIGLASLTALSFIAIGILTFYQAIANTVRALLNKCVHYPLSIQFLK